MVKTPLTGRMYQGPKPELNWILFTKYLVMSILHALCTLTRLLQEKEKGLFP
jgi:hypothetical protein